MNKRLLEVLDYLESVNEKEVLVQKVTAYGYQFAYDVDLYGSVSLYRFKENNIQELLSKINNQFSTDIINFGYKNKGGKK